MESSRHRKKRWASDKPAGIHGEKWAKITEKIAHPLDKVGTHKKNDEPYDIYRKPRGKPRIRIEVKLNNTPLSKRQKEFQKKRNTSVKRVSRNNPVHVTQNIKKKLQKIYQ